MDPLQVSRRLKAARWLAGTATDANGKPLALTADELAKREPMASNGLTANAIGELERMTRVLRPMEIRIIASALGVPYSFFEGPDLLFSAQPAADAPQAPEGGLARELEDDPPRVQNPPQTPNPAEEDPRRDAGG
jgi:hypothetical protein